MRMKWSLNCACAPARSVLGIWQVEHLLVAVRHDFAVLLALEFVLEA